MMRLWHRVNQRIKKFYEQLLVKGNEHITIMFIPHSEKKIFTFKVSNFLIVFIFTIVLVFTMGGSYLFVDRNNFERKVSSLNLNYIKILSVLETIKNHMNHVKQTSSKVLQVTDNILDVVDMNPIKKIYRASYQGGPDQDDYEFLKPFFENLKSLNENEIIEIKKLLFLGNDLDGIYRNLSGLEGLLKNFKHVFKDIPSIYPILGSNTGRGYITSEFGWRRDPFRYRIVRHYGIDIVNIPGTPVLASANGFVRESGRNSSKGIFIEIDHKYGYESRYYHLSSSNVGKGKRVFKGQVIGRIGSSGKSTGPHLHYEIRVNNVPVNPKPFMNLDPFYK